MKILHTSILVIASICAASAAATTISPPNQWDAAKPITKEASAPQGIRISASGDFQIVEHGYWPPPERPLLPENLATGAANSTQHQRQQKKFTKFHTNFRRTTFLRDVHAAEARFGLPHGLLDALIWAESRYNPSAVSSAGAAGLGQLMSGTAKDLGVANRFDPQANILGAALYLRQMLDRFGMVHLALAAYNAGPGAVKKARGIPLNSETPSYVRSIMIRWKMQ